MKSVSLAFVMLFVYGCAGSATVDQSDDAALSFDGLNPVKNSVFKRAWVDPDTDFSNYDKIFLGQTDFEFRTVKKNMSKTQANDSNNAASREFYITPENRTKLTDTFTQAFRAELATSTVFTLTDQPGADTLILVGGLNDIVSRIPPVSAGSGQVFLASLGEATLVFELRDSLSGETLYRAADRQKVGNQHTAVRADSASSWHEVEAWARRWADMLRDGLDATHE